VLRRYYNYEFGQCSSGRALVYLGLLGLESGHWVAYYTFCPELKAV